MDDWAKIPCDTNSCQRGRKIYTSMKIDKKKRIAVDLDGTLTNHARFPEIWDLTPKQLMKLYDKVKPDKEMIHIINNLYENGFIIYIFTSRSDLLQKQIEDWLDKNDVKYHYFIANKPFYDILIDDKAITPEVAKLWARNT